MIIGCYACNAEHTPESGRIHWACRYDDTIRWQRIWHCRKEIAFRSKHRGPSLIGSIDCVNPRLRWCAAVAHRYDVGVFNPTCVIDTIGKFCSPYREHPWRNTNWNNPREWCATEPAVISLDVAPVDGLVINRNPTSCQNAGCSQAVSSACLLWWQRARSWFMSAQLLGVL